MSKKALWFLAAFSLLSGTAAADQTWVLNVDGVYLQRQLPPGQDVIVG